MMLGMFGPLPKFDGKTGIAPKTAPKAEPPKAEPSKAEPPKALPAGVQGADSKFVKLTPQAPFRRAANPNDFMQITAKLLAGAAAKFPAMQPGPQLGQSVAGPAQRKAEAQAEQKLRSGSLGVGDFEGIGPEKAGSLAARMAAGDAKQRQNLGRLMDDPAFAKHLGTALSKMDPANAMKLMDSLYKSGAPSEQVVATLHRGLDAMEPAKRGALMNEALQGADPETKKAAEGYLGAKLRSGQLKPEHFQGLDQQAATGLIEQMATGGKTQRDNLSRLMGHQDFGKRLGPALEDMKPEARQQVLRAAGENPGGAQKTLERALDGMSPSRRSETLRDAYLNGDRSVLDAANRYVGGSNQRGAELYASLGKQLSGDPAKLGAALGQLSAPAMASVLGGLGSLPAGEAQAQFRKLGDAVYGPPKNEELRARVAEGMSQYPASSAQLLAQVARDRYGSDAQDSRVNNGQRLLSDLFDHMSPAQSKQFLAQAGPADAAALQQFTRLNARDEAVQKGADAGADTRAAREEIGKAMDGQVNYYAVAFNGPGKVQRAAILEQLQKDPSGILRDMEPAQVKQMVKLFMKDGNMDQLAKILPELTPQSAAKLASVIQMAASETKAEVKAGSWLGDLVGSVKLSAEGGIQGAKVKGEAGLDKVVSGGRQRELNGVEQSLNDFTLAWTAHLNKMSPNDKQVFLDSLGTPPAAL